MKPLGVRLCNWLEISRYILISLGVFVAEFKSDPQQQLIIISAFFVISIAGLTGVEGLWLGKYASSISGYTDSGRYQKQSALNNLSLAITSILATLLSWGVMAHLALLSALCTFLFLSGMNHALDAICSSNRSLRNMFRPIASLLLITLSLKYILAALA